MGAYHAAEIPNVFDNLGRVDRPWEDADRALAQRMASYSVSFAEDGDPNGEGLPQWPAYTVESDTAMAFGAEAAPRSAIRQRELDLFDRLVVAAQRGQ